jgi:hypothetical protein
MPRGGTRPGAGRPAGSENVDTAAMRAAIEALADIAKNGRSEAARVSAACAILDRTHGRPRPSPPASRLLGTPSGPFDEIVGQW